MKKQSKNQRNQNTLILLIIWLIFSTQIMTHLRAFFYPFFVSVIRTFSKQKMKKESKNQRNPNNLILLIIWLIFVFSNNDSSKSILLPFFVSVIHTFSKQKRKKQSKNQRNQKTLILLIILLFEISKAYCNRGQWGNSKSKGQKN